MAHLFDGMTNLYSLSKTLRFELKPVGKTGELVGKEGFFKKDIQKDDLYGGMKEKMDELHRVFIEKSLSQIASLPITYDIMQYFLDKNVKELDKHYKSLRNIIASSFQGSKTLLEKEVIDNLIASYPDQKDDIEQFKGFFGYFKTYTQNRASLYKNEDKAGQIAFRLIDENLPRFFKIKQIIDEIIIKYPDFIVVERNEKQQEIQKNISTYQSYFQLDQYHNYLCQSGIDRCNEVVGHINLSINLYKQKTGNKISLLPLLYKLPLAPRKVISRLPQQLESLEQVHQSIDTIIERLDSRIIPFISSIFDPKKEYDYRGIYISIKASENRGTIALTGWQSLRELTHKPSKNGNEAELKDNKFPFVSIHSIKEHINNKQIQGDDPKSIFGEKIGDNQNGPSFTDYFIDLITKHMISVINKYHEVNSSYQKNKNKESIKGLLDVSLELWRFINGFALIHKKQHLQIAEKDSNFYDGVDGLDQIINDDNYPDPIHTLYDKIRNYLTKKPYNNDEKIKVNFGNPTLLDGRDQNKEKDNFGIILREGNNYYLAIMKKGNSNFFDESKNTDLYKSNNDSMQKMIYKLLPGPNKMLPKVIFSEKNIHSFNPSAEILRIRKEETFKQGDSFSLADLHTWVDFLKQCLGMYEGWKHFNFIFRQTQQYTKINEFYHDIERQGYEIKRKNINKEILMQAVHHDELYLFQIYNKDFNQFATGNKNIHTKYFEAVFAGGSGNLFKLNGEAEIFWRKGVLAQKIRGVSPKNKIDIIDKKRYTEDKVMLHVPITLNFCHQENSFNKHINSYIASHQTDFTILGIDRGEKHLLYYSLIRQDGTIIKTDSRNMIGKTNYHEKLDKREKDRDQAQVNRDQQEQIKDLKKGYISQVIHEICNLVIEHNAIIILEDLNGGFKRSRQKVEKSVYQQFELALAKKLNYLVFKNISDEKPGGTMKGYQLTPPVSQFQDLSFQTGIIFYTAPGYTSTTCPCCGWRKNLYLEYKNEKQARELLSKIDIQKFTQGRTITYQSEGNLKSKKSITFKKFTIHTRNQTRLSYNPKNKSTDPYDVDTEFTKILGDTNHYQHRLLSASVSQLKSLVYSINLLMKMRNSQTGTDIDLIQCPACGFDSRDGFQKNKYNGDANGAYNIARKGKLIMNKLIKEGKTTITQSECDDAWIS